MTKHTAGPWRFDSHRVITEVPISKDRTFGYGCQNDFICDLDDGEYHNYASEDEMVANGQLIAAAPDLLAACEAMVAWGNTPTVYTTEGTRTALQELTNVGVLMRAAIAKAKGGQSE